MIHKMARQRRNMTRVFSETCKRRFATILMKKRNYFEGLTDGRKMPYIVVVDSADCDMV